MKVATATLAALLVVTLIFSATEIKASDPNGIYALVEKVVFEPSEAAPERIQIWGSFSFATHTGSDGTAYGYMYYRLTPANESVARKEWSDFKSIAGSGRAVSYANGYGYDYASTPYKNGRVRQAAAKVEDPDNYPTGFGLAALGASDPVIPKLQEALRTHKSPAPDTRLSGKIVMTGGSPLPNRLSLQATTADGRMFSAGSANSNESSIGADGLFRLHVPNGLFHLSASLLPLGYYVKAISMGTRDIFDGGLTTGNSSPEFLTVTLSAGGGAVDGYAMDGTAGANYAFVVLVPEISRRQNPALYRTAMTDQVGRFSLNRIEPGQYKLFAFPTNRVQGTAYLNASFMAKYERDGHAMTITSDPINSIRIPVIP